MKLLLLLSIYSVILTGIPLTESRYYKPVYVPYIFQLFRDRPAKASNDDAHTDRKTDGESKTDVPVKKESMPEIANLRLKGTGKHQVWLCFQHTLTPSLAEHDMPCRSKQCRSRSVGILISSAWQGLILRHLNYLSYFTPKFVQVYLLSVDLSKNYWMSPKQCRPWLDSTLCSIWQSRAISKTAFCGV